MKLLKIAFCVLCFVCAGLVYADEDTRSHGSCKYCGMDRQTFGHSRMLLEYTDGTSAGTCSIHCTTIELVSQAGMVPCTVKVGDYHSRKLIDAYKAFWVIGGSKQGVMTSRAKWAFQHEQEAREFVRQYGGGIGNFYLALKAAFEDLHEEVRLTLQRTETRQERGVRLCK